MSNNPIDNPFQAKGFIGLVVNFYPLLEDMTRRGIPMNVTSLEKLDAEIDVEVAQLVKKLDEIVPNELKGFHPKEGYKRTPMEVKDAMEEWQQAQNPMFMITGSVSYGDTNGNMVCGDLAQEITETDRSKQARNSTLEDWIFECTKNSEGVGLVEREFDSAESIANRCPFCDNLLAKSTTCLECLGVGYVTSKVKVKRWCRILPFNPNSSQQVSKLIKHYSDDKLAKQIVAKLHKDELDGDEFEGETASPTNKVVLRKLGERTGREVYGLIVDIRELLKVKGTFIAGWMPKDIQEVWTKEPETYCKIGRVHPQFSMRPATGQLNSYKPNAQNQIKHSGLGKRFRNCIESYPNHTLVEFDMTGYHALMMGFFAKDKDYIRLVGIDIHSYVTGWIVKYPDIENCLSWDDDRLRVYLKEIKNKYETEEFDYLRTNKAKKILLGRNLGLSVYGAFERYKDNFMPSIEDCAMTFRDFKKKFKEESARLEKLGEWSEKELIQRLILELDMSAKIQERREKLGREEVKKIYNIFDTIFPKPVQWQKAILKQANEDGYLKSVYGFIRRFWNVEEPTFDRFGNFTGSRRGEQAEQALAQLIQNSAFGHMRQIMLELGRLGLLDKYRLINTIHDSLVFECPNEYLNECIKEVSRVMQLSSELLKNEVMPEGFKAMVEVMVGKRFGDLKEVKI